MTHHNHDHGPQKAPGILDVLAAAVLFWLLTWGLYAALDVSVPGMLKAETLVQVRLSGGLFILFWALMGNFLVRPYVELAIEREDKTSGALTLAAERTRESKDILNQLDGELKQVRLQALSERDALADAAKKEAQQTLLQALDLAEARRKKAVEEIGLLKAEAQKDVAEEAQKLATLVVERALSPSAAIGPVQ